MSSQIVEYVFSGSDNINILQLQDDATGGTNFTDTDLSGATKVAIVFDDDASTTYNSTDHATLISYESDGKVTLKLGNASLPVGSYIAYFVVYDSANTNGIRWQQPIRVRKI